MSDRYLNRELSWLEFNRRVLAIAEEEETPLLERVKFLAIFSTNLDEFFQVRVAGLLEQVAAGVSTTPPDGMTPTEQMGAIRQVAGELMRRQAEITEEIVIPMLAKQGIRFVNYDELDGDDRTHLDDQFRDTVYPVLTPLAVDPAHPFPYISNLSLNLAVTIRDPDTAAVRFARVKIPPILSRFVVMPDGERIVPLEQVIAHHLGDLFPGMEILSHYTFRVTRNADLSIEEAEADDLLEAVAMELSRRRFGRAVRLEVGEDMPVDTVDLLRRELRLDDSDVYRIDGLLDLTGMWTIAGLDRPDLKWPVWPHHTPLPLVPVDGSAPNIFDVLRTTELLVQHPYDSFAGSVEELLRQAAADPDVLAIKQTVYRAGQDSGIVGTLISAANAGKQVVVLVELKARFEEEQNIEWARRLEEAGAHVVYGFVGLKTHAKVMLIVRREGESVRRYAHVGTGNYNGATAKLYEDVGLLTADEDLAADLSDLFNYLTGYSRQEKYRKLLVSPFSLRSQVIELIRREAAAHDGHIVIKVNSLVDAQVIDELYAASAAGTKVELLVRGICCLRAGVEGLSENIRVRSVVGRYLEHSRVFRFGSHARGHDYFIGSADLMPRNLDRRVEAMAPVEAPALRSRLEEALDVMRSSKAVGWDLQPDDTWQPTAGTVDVQQELQIRAAARSSEGSDLPRSLSASD